MTRPFFASLASSSLLVALLAPGCSTSTTPPVDSGGGTADSNVDAGPLPDAGRDASIRVPTNHRESDAQCQAAAPAGTCSFGGGAGMCDMDSDCTTGTNGRCNMNNGGAVFCRCTYDACQHDTDCPTGSTCACHGAVLHGDSNECIPGNCRVDADCGAGGYCSPTVGGCGGLGGYYCHTTNDLCVDDTDCATGSLQACQYVSTSSRWECVDLLLCP